MNNRTLDWQKDESDQMILDLAKKIHPANVLVPGILKIKGFTRMVGDLAEILLEYFQKITMWVELLQSNPQSYDNDQMDIFICSHSQNVECFLMKFIEIKKGAEFLDKFLSSLPHRKSFIGYSEGFSLIVYANHSQFYGILHFQNFSWKITKTDLVQMILERDQFHQQVEKNLQDF